MSHPPRSKRARSPRTVDSSPAPTPPRQSRLTLRTAWLLAIVAFGITAMQSGSGAQPFATSVTIASPAAVLEPSVGSPTDADGYPPAVGNADPEEATLAVRLAIASAVNSPVLVVSRSDDEGIADLSINESGSDGTTLTRGLDGLDGVLDGRLAAGD